MTFEYTVGLYEYVSTLERGKEGKEGKVGERGRGGDGGMELGSQRRREGKKGRKGERGRHEVREPRKEGEREGRRTRKE